ncbi:hemolysin family protein [Aneurinibacillus sp. Ricciae_BoGa-3]|uniref:hemolysin family protein n=1 Tax=Aneurinibacillus sp. Ricciae_BoGa-3 TaxID=3022697 RepID=UPI0023414FCB|nr:hemolysin family protein [Aneurinibacillus sp. Ricciae_BoGa-3]WCK53927.1 hemolysin family protein [Aneurinibacillus sp. Ricciae_BoGa-3]
MGSIINLLGSVGRLIGINPTKDDEEGQPEEELRFILDQSLDRGEINSNQYTYLMNIFKFEERVAREIMVPRTEMVCLNVDAPLEENIVAIKKEGYTRFPVIEGDKDHIIGILHTKDLFFHYLDNPRIDIKTLIRPAIFANDGSPLQSLLQRMKEERASLALLVDEYGGTAGLVTMEDILEQIVGEIHDEFDQHETDPIQIIGNDHFLVDNKVLLSEIEDLTGIAADPEFDTIGGWVAAQVMDIQEGKQVKEDNWLITIKKTRGLTIKQIEVKRLAES